MGDCPEWISQSERLPRLVVGVGGPRTLVLDSVRPMWALLHQSEGLSYGQRASTIAIISTLARASFPALTSSLSGSSQGCFFGCHGNRNQTKTLFANIDISEGLVRQSLDKLVQCGWEWVWIVKGAGSLGLPSGKNSEILRLSLALLGTLRHPRGGC